jgi:hypothetical protein
MMASQFYLQLGKQNKVGWVGDDCRDVFVQKFPVLKERVKMCIVVMQ